MLYQIKNFCGGLILTIHVVFCRVMCLKKLLLFDLTELYLKVKALLGLTICNFITNKAMILLHIKRN